MCKNVIKTVTLSSQYKTMLVIYCDIRLGGYDFPLVRVHSMGCPSIKSLHTPALHFTEQYFTALSFTALSFTALYFTALYFIALYFTAQHCTTLY